MGKAVNEVRQSLLNSLQCQAEEGGEWLLTIGGTEYSGEFNHRLGQLIFKPTYGEKGKVRRFRILVEEVEFKESLFVAVAFGGDGWAGDSSFACDYAIPATSKSTFKELLATWTKAQDEDGELENCFGDDHPVGFWILTTKALNVVKSTVRECHNDSAAYVQNSNGKALVARLALRVVGDKTALTMPLDCMP